MTEIEKAIEYYEKECRLCERAGMKGNPCHCYQETALEALRSQAERSRGCPWCKAEYTIIDDDFGQPVHPNMIKFCWRCGRALKGGE